jgi:putative nucleotidyltransferase with HDIG domain
VSADAGIGRLLEAPSVTVARDALAEAGIAGWLVGGVVRDALLGRELGDVDLAVAGDPSVAARAISRAVGGPAFELSADFGSWRALDRSSGATFDVTRLQGATIEEDLANRDFSINALALPLAGGDVIDPTGGRADLDAGVLRLAAPGAYDADPLRTLRLVRMATELGLAPDADTERLTRAAASRLAEPAAERVYAELRRILSAPAAVAGLRLADRLGVLEVVLPELVALRGIEQSRFHHLDVYEHTLEVLDRLIEIESDPAAVFGPAGDRVAAVLAEPLGDGLTRGEALRIGALLHDIAKPATRAVRDDGRVTFVGHSTEGERMSGETLRRLKTGEKVRSFVGALTREHLALGFLMHRRPLDRSEVHAYLRETEPVELEVTLLSCADRMATRGEGQEEWIEGHLELARELIEPVLDWRAGGPPAPLVRGDELARELGIAPGPELGDLLAALERATYTGEVSTREGALALARSLREDGPR